MDEEEQPQETTEDEPEEVDEDDLEDTGVADAALGPDDEVDSEETSLDELLSQRAASRRGADQTDETDTDDIMALTSEKDSPTVDALPTRVIPVKDRQEFVCSNCHLVKARSQLADADRMLCRDCA